MTLEAMIGARQIGGTAIFSQLGNGDWFKFPRDPAIMVKEGPRRYRILGGTSTFQTRRHVAVVPCPELQSPEMRVEAP